MSGFSFHSTSEEVCAKLASEIKGRTILVTGVSPGGLGMETARAISLQSPKLIILAGRNSSKVQEAQDALSKAAPETPTRKLIVDLASIASVRKAAGEVNSWDDVPTIDVVINNAGIMAVPYELTEDGIEKQFHACHIGHFLLTQLIMPKILAAGKGSRVVNLSSSGYNYGDRGVRFDDLNFENGKTYEKWAAYGQAKSANILYSKALTQKYKEQGLLSFSVHPGGIWTNLGHHAVADLKAGGYLDENGKTINTNVVWKTLGEGTSTSVVAAFDPSIADQSGAYLSDCQICETKEDFVTDPALPDKLWKLSEKLVGQEF